MRSPYAIGVLLTPIISGTLGPYTSASIRPALYPSDASPTARFTATVVFPTPPFPEPTAIRFLTPGIGILGIWPGWFGVISSIVAGRVSVDVTSAVLPSSLSLIDRHRGVGRRQNRAVTEGSGFGLDS